MRTRPLGLAAALLSLISLFSASLISASLQPAHAQPPSWLSPLPSANPPPPRPVTARPVAVGPAAAPTPGLQCRRAISTAERAAGIPRQLMAAIARVESGRRNADGSVDPWPWSIDADGESHVYDTKAQAIAAVRALQAQGVRSIDVGCMQVNLLHHPDAFATLDDAFDPAANAGYAARFLVQLREQTGAWPTATAWYHSATPELGSDYARRVMAVWPDEQRLGAPPSEAGLPRPLPAPFAVRPIPVAARSVAAKGQAAAPGRSLADYRAAPIQLAARPAPLPHKIIP